MRREWFIIEKIISIALIIWGGLLFYSVLRGLFYLFNRIPLKEVSLATTFKNFHIMFFLPLATIIGGFLLLFNKKPGWIISLITLLLNGIIYLIPPNRHTHHFSSSDLNSFIVISIMTTICSSLFIILLQNPFQTKYNPTRYTWLIIVLVTTAVIIDRTTIFWLSKSF